MKELTLHDIALLYFADWEIDYVLTQRGEEPSKVLARMANESLRGRACPEYLIETGSGKVRYFKGSVWTRDDKPTIEITTIKLARIALAAPRQVALQLEFVEGEKE